MLVAARRLVPYVACAAAWGACEDGSEVLPREDATTIADADAEIVLPPEVIVLDTPSPTIVCPAVPLADGPTLGRSDADFCFEPLAPGVAATIVHGLQGGIHVELRLAFASSQAPRVSYAVELVDDGTTLARYALESAHAVPRLSGTDGAFATPAFPVVFASADATLYHGLRVDVRATVVVDGEPLALPPIEVELVDPALTAPTRGPRGP